MLLYYLFIYPLSKLPLCVLYPIGKLAAFILQHLLKYRKTVIDQNLRRSFPNKSDQEIAQLTSKSYQYLGELLAEGIRNLSISPKELLQRLNFEKNEALLSAFKNGESIILLSSHYGNWEWWITAQALCIPHRAFGIGKPLKAGYINQKVNSRRERFGLKVVHAKNYKEELAKSTEPCAVLVLADQAPTPETAIWLPFLNQTTPFAMGAEIISRTSNMKVFYLGINRAKRGYYMATCTLLSPENRLATYGEIMSLYAQLLENQIKEHPEFWLWSHKRWKHPVPSNIQKLQNEQKAKFYQRFG